MNGETDDVRISNIQVCQDLLAYVYHHHFKKLGSTEIRGPYRTIFPKSAGQLLIHYCNIFKPSFRKVFLKTFPAMCSSEIAFAQYVIQHCNNLLLNYPFYSFMVASSFIANLVLFCFENSCYRFINAAPFCMFAVMNRIQNHSDAADPQGWNMRLGNYCMEANFHADHFKVLVDSSVDESLSEPVQAKQRTTLGRLYLRNFIDEIEGQLRGGIMDEPLLESDISLIRSNEIHPDLYPDILTRHADVCSICNTRCVFYYKMYVISQNASESE